MCGTASVLCLVRLVSLSPSLRGVCARRGAGNVIISAEAENGLGVDGALYNSQIIPIKVADDAGDAYTSDIVDAINRVRAYRSAGLTDLRVINLSMGSDNYDQACEDAINEAAQDGILFVCAAGNAASTEPVYPSDYEGAFSVMALEEDQRFASYTCYNQHKNIAAVGTARSTYIGGDSSYDTYSGTSMASPLVAGVAALVWSVDPSMSVQQVREILETTAADVPEGGASIYWSNLETEGKVVKQIDANAAVARAVELSGGGSSGSTHMRKLSDIDITSVFAYDGKPHQAVPTPQANGWYTLCEDPTNRLSVISATDASALCFGGDAQATDPDQYERYETTVRLTNPQDEWDDGTKADKTVQWYIKKRGLSVAFEESWVPVCGPLPTDKVVATGFVTGQDASNLPGFRLPHLRWANDGEQGEGVPIDAAVAAGITSSAGEYRIVPDFVKTDVNDYNATSNYEFTSFLPGKLHVYNVATAPQGKTLTYNGIAQTGVAGGVGYALLGQSAWRRYRYA